MFGKSLLESLMNLKAQFREIQKQMDGTVNDKGSFLCATCQY